MRLYHAWRAYQAGFRPGLGPVPLRCKPWPGGLRVLLGALRHRGFWPPAGEPRRLNRWSRIRWAPGRRSP